MDILNFISWLKGGKYSTTIPTNAVTVVGIPTLKRDDKYLPVTVPISALQTNIGKLMGGGIVVSEWVENGVHKALVASLTDLSTSLPWTIPSLTGGPAVPLGSTSFSDGFTNTNNIIAQTGTPADVTYAAGLARLHNGGDFTDWYLPALWELELCYNSAAIVNKVLGPTNGFAVYSYWSSTENGDNSAGYKYFLFGDQNFSGKSFTYYVRAVRIHTL
jgi:hypothetical protein